MPQHGACLEEQRRRSAQTERVHLANARRVGRDLLLRRRRRQHLVSEAPSAKTYEANVKPEVLELDKKMGAFPLGLTDEDVEIVRAEDLFQR